MKKSMLVMVVVLCTTAMSAFAGITSIHAWPWVANDTKSPDESGFRVQRDTVLEEMMANGNGDTNPIPIAYRPPEILTANENTYPPEGGGHAVFIAFSVVSGEPQALLRTTSYEFKSDDPNNVLGDAGDFVNHTFSESRIGYWYGPDGIKGTDDDVIFTSSEHNGQSIDSSQLINELHCVCKARPFTGTVSAVQAYLDFYSGMKYTAVFRVEDALSSPSIIKATEEVVLSFGILPTVDPPEPEPEPEPDPEPEPEPEPEPDSEPVDPDPEPDPEPVDPDPEPDSEPVDPDPEPEPDPEPVDPTDPTEVEPGTIISSFVLEEWTVVPGKRNVLLVVILKSEEELAGHLRFFVLNVTYERNSLPMRVSDFLSTFEIQIEKDVLITSTGEFSGEQMQFNIPEDFVLSKGDNTIVVRAQLNTEAQTNDKITVVLSGFFTGQEPSASPIWIPDGLVTRSTVKMLTVTTNRLTDGGDSSESAVLITGMDPRDIVERSINLIDWIPVEVKINEEGVGRIPKGDVRKALGGGKIFYRVKRSVPTQQ